MDVLDKKILYELDTNARISYTALAKKLQEAPETIRFRTQRLEENTITNYVARINTVALGWSYYEIFIKTTQASTQQRKEITKFLCNHNNVAWVGELLGTYDYGIILLASHQQELQVFWQELEKQYANNILRKDVLINLEAQFHPRNYLIQEHRAEAHHYDQAHQAREIDQKDHELLKELATNARTPAATLAQDLGVSGQTIARRIRNLKHKNILFGYSAQLNNQQANIHHHKTLLKLRVQDAQTTNAILQTLAEHPNVIAVVHTLGAWDLEIDTESFASQAAEELLMQLTAEYSREIIDYNILRVTHMPKYTFYPHNPATPLNNESQ